jgi:membrane-associated phospholipid phosphatase
VSVSFHQLWMAATNLGDSAVMLPCIALITLWLATPAATRALAWRWLLLVFGVMSVVAASKLAFMGWLISLPGLDFTGLSGHSTTSAVVWPALGALLGRRRGPHMQAWGALLGLLIALAVSGSRLVLHAHSVSEAVLGSLTGATASLVFLYRHRAYWCLPERTWVALLSLLLVLPWVYGDRFPSETLLKDIASQLSGHAAYRREDLRRARHPAPDHAVVPVR